MDRRMRTELYEQLARPGKALGNGRRLELLELLAQGPRGVVQLAEAAGLGVTSTSAHLHTLRDAGLVVAEREGTSVRYRVSGPDVAALYDRLVAVAAAHSADVDASARRYLGPDDTDRVDHREVLRRIDAGSAVLLDVRPALEHAAGHIPGAISIPLDELPDRMAELPAGAEVVVYCRSTYCGFAHDAVRLLTAHGHRAVRLTDGIVGWRATGERLSTADTRARGPHPVRSDDGSDPDMRPPVPHGATTPRFLAPIQHGGAAAVETRGTDR